MTGEAVSTILKSGKVISTIQYPYRVREDEVKSRLELLQTSFEEARESMLQLWKGIPEFKNEVITAIDVEALCHEATSVSFTSCKSKEWRRIG